MSVTNGQVANQTTFNNAFVSRTTDTSTTGKLALNNADTVSGTSVPNPQREHNSIAYYVGKALNGVKDLLPAWTSTNVGSPTDNITERVEALTAAFGATSRAAVEPISISVDTVAVTFSTPWVDAAYVLDFCFENLIDASPIFLQGIVTARDANGFTVKLNAVTDTADYTMNYSIREAV